MSNEKTDNIADRIVARLGRFAEQLEVGVPAAEFLLTIRNRDDLRQYLRNRGWRRHDRTSGGVSEELWQSPYGHQPRAIKLESAIRNQLKRDGVCL